MTPRAARLDRYALYELCAQAPDRTARFLHAVHGRSPRVFRDDFAGPAGLARAWVRVVPDGRAIAVDRDPEPLARAAGARGEDVEIVVADVLRTRRRADVIAALNFAVCELHDRATLLRYLRAARASLNPGGILACDLYGGAEAYTPGSYTRRLRAMTGERVEYTWAQRSADPTTARVVNTMTFTVWDRPGSSRGRKPSPRTLRDAFVYDWRLWTIAELREAMDEAGFDRTEVYDSLGDATDDQGRLYVRPLDRGDALDENYVVYVVGRNRR